MSNNSENTVLVHKFTDAGLGGAPFTVVACISIPSPSLAEHNPNAYNMALREMCLTARAYKVSFGSCDYCGTPLTNNMIVRNAAGGHFVVGCDCAEKTGDAKVMTEAAALERTRRREHAQARRQERWRKHREEVEAGLAAERERNAGLTDWEVQENARKAAEQARIDARMKVVGDIVTSLRAIGDDFCDAMAKKLIYGNVSHRMAECITKNLVGTTGRRNKANAAEWDLMIDRCMGPEE